MQNTLSISNQTASINVVPEFILRIVVCDSYLSRPVPGLDVIYSEFRGNDIKQVPVLRIFGSTPDGKKGCLHVHGVFPYFYIPCPIPNPEPQFLYQVAASLDKALNIALKQATSNNQHVYKITLVKGLPFYGFHDKEHLFLKVFLYNPGLLKQAVELCSNGAILGQVLQPHESHLNFTLQFFIDFNLFGMSNIELLTVQFRASISYTCSEDPLDNLDTINLKRESICYYEADCAASHIINRLHIGKGDGIENPGLEEVWNQEMERRKQLNISIASNSLTQERLLDEGTETHQKYKDIFLVKLANFTDKPPDIINEVVDVHYPAETLDGSQFFNATDVNTHLIDSTFRLGLSKNESISINDTTIVNEDIALSSTIDIQYSQISLDTDDLELVNLLEDLDEKVVDEDSVMKTPAIDDLEDELSNDEYSQVFNEETILQECEIDETSPAWNDSFWEGANIPQLDGNCDDECVKTFRKRKKLPLKLGLSRPKVRIKYDCNETHQLKSNNSDEINESRETINCLSEGHLKTKYESVMSKEICDISQKSKSILENESIVSLVERIDTANSQLQNTEPKAGPSRKSLEFLSFDDKHSSSSDGDEKEIESFYDQSKFFDYSLDNSLKDENGHPHVSQNNNINMEVKQSIPIPNDKVSSDNLKIFTHKFHPPSKNDIISTLTKYNIPKIKNLVPHYSNYKDVGDKIEIGQIILKLNSKSAQDQKQFEKVLDTTSIEEWRQLLFIETNGLSEENSKLDSLKLILAGNRSTILKPLHNAPTKFDIIRWCENNPNSNKKKYENVVEDIEVSVKPDDLENSQAIGLNDNEIENSLSLEDKNKSQLNSTLQISMHTDGSFLCFKKNQSQKELSLSPSAIEVDFMTIMVAEVLTSTRNDLNPDPLVDGIEAVFLTVSSSCPENHNVPKKFSIIIIVDDMKTPKYLDRCIFNTHVVYVSSENELIENIINLVKEHDPDIMCGYEIEMNSWGYILERAQIIGREVVKEISRITDKTRQKRWRHDENEMEGRIIGRITFNVWRLFRHELALSSYSFENCMYVILNERVPKYSFAQLSTWWNEESRMFRWITVEYYMTRLSGTIRMLEKLDIVNRTSELARLFGLQWWEVLSRGSQFRVESLMLRAARPLNLVALSPTVKQRAAMRAPECLPLIFEPESRFYQDPVIVLDFQSLYPSMMIAYNYCFSTCIGRVQNINSNTPYEFGAWRLRISEAKLKALAKNDLINWSPVGVGFVKPSVRRGVLPALLRRILAARQAVKKGMKLQTDETVKKAMHSRQLGLKLIANVTYGYTAANFSGRMPCVEVGDSVVAKGRETLERAIKLVRNGSWNAKVIYGDTDSMFVLVPGGTRAEAFDIGQQIADAVTADNPSPVVLKLEKVYQPCILQTKKRYVGYMYESKDQEKPIYEAKGIETVRRDGCPAGVKLLQRSLCELFESGDMSRVKRIASGWLSKLCEGSLPPHDLFFTREYHGAAGYRPTAAAPPNEIAKRLLSRDRRGAPRPGERVSWLVCAGAPGTPLVRLARTPAELTRDASLVPHITYYATRALLPPLHRCLSLLGVDVFKWWNEVGHTREVHIERGTGAAPQMQHGGGGIARYMERGRCAVCGARGARALCGTCAARTLHSAALLAARATRLQTQQHHCHQICTSCCSNSGFLKCENTECPILWKRSSIQQKLNQLEDVVSNLPEQFNIENRYI